MLQSYEIILIYANIFATFFVKIRTKNNPPLLPDKAALLDDKAGLLLTTDFCGHFLFIVVVAEVLAVGWQLVVDERGQHLLQLQEEPFAGGIAVGKHVKRETPPILPFRGGA